MDAIHNVVRCGTCHYHVNPGYCVYEDTNAAEKDACLLFSNFDYDYDWTSWWYVDPNKDYCSFRNI